MIRLIIYEDNEKLRHSLELFLDGQEDITVVGAFNNCNKAAEQAVQLEPRVVLMDIDMPGASGIEGVSSIKAENPDISILMHTVFDDDQKIFNSLAAGADGYLLKKAGPQQLYQAILDISQGGAPMSPGVAKRVLESFREGGHKEQVGLSSREMEVLRMLTKGYTYKRISMECSISVDTTRTHIKNIYTKLHVNCGTEAVAKALRLKLLD